MAERFGVLPIDVLRRCSWEHMFATLNIVREIQDYRDWKSNEGKGEKAKPKKVGLQGFFDMFGKSTTKDGRITG